MVLAYSIRRLALDNAGMVLSRVLALKHPNYIKLSKTLIRLTFTFTTICWGLFILLNLLEKGGRKKFNYRY